jgi:hypothetical protein
MKVDAQVLFTASRTDEDFGRDDADSSSELLIEHRNLSK